MTYGGDSVLDIPDAVDPNASCFYSNSVDDHTDEDYITPAQPSPNDSYSAIPFAESANSTPSDESSFEEGQGHPGSYEEAQERQRQQNDSQATNRLITPAKKRKIQGRK